MDNSATIYLRHKYSKWWGTTRLEVLVDDKLIAILISKSFVEFSVPQGRHALLIKMRGSEVYESNPFDLVVEAGRRYELVCVLGTEGLIRGRPKPRVWFESMKSGNGLPAASTTKLTSPLADGDYSYSIIEKTRSSKSIGHDVIEIDNSDGVAEVERQLTLSKEWVRELTFAYEKATTKNFSGQAGPTWLAIKAGIENCVTERYSMRSQETRRFEEQMKVRVPAGSNLEMHLTWKVIIQHGSAVATDESSTVASIPFEIVVGLTFDQRQKKV